MKITFVLDTFGGGGKERRCLQLIQGLEKTYEYNIQVIIVNNDVAYHELYDCKAQLHILNRKEEGKGFTTVRNEIKSLLKVFKPDIVQAWGYLSAMFVLTLPPHRRPLLASYVADADAPAAWSMKLVNAACCCRCKYIIGNSLAGMKAYEIPRKKGVCIYNGFNEARFYRTVDKSNKKNVLGIDTPYVVTMTANFWPNKDWRCYLEAAKIITRQRDDITFLAVGDGPQWEMYNNQLTGDDHSLIRMLGRRDDVDELCQVTDLSVLCTNASVHGEGISNSIMEAMAWGVPVIATDGGGTPEIIEDGKNGLLIQEQTPNKLAEMVVGLIDDEETCQAFSKAAAKTVRERFLLSRMIEDYDKLYHQCL